MVSGRAWQFFYLYYLRPFQYPYKNNKNSSLELVFYHLVHHHIIISIKYQEI